MSIVKTSKGVALALMLGLLTGCLPLTPDPGGGGTAGALAAYVTIRYQAVMEIIQDEIYADPFQTTRTVSVIHETGGTFASDAAGRLYSGSASLPGVTATATVLLNTAGDTVLSLQANRDKIFGVSDEWERIDNVVAENIPLTGTAGDVHTYRLEGAAACEAILVLYYAEVRSPTPSIPDAGPSYVVVDQNDQICNEMSYIEVEIEYRD
jgi:hypothetical protein